MKSIQELANALAVHLREAAPTVADLPDEGVLTSFLMEGLREQMGEAATHLQAVRSDGITCMIVGDEPVSDLVHRKPAAAGALSEQVGGNHYKDMKIQH